MIRFVVCLFVAFLICGCASVAQKIVKEPKVALSGVNLKDVTHEGGIVMINVQVDNPNPFALTVDALDYNLEIGGKKLSTGKLEQPARVEGNGTSIVQVPVPVKFNDLFSSAMDFLQKRTTKYRITGNARFGLITIPFDNGGDLKLDQ